MTAVSKGYLLALMGRQRTPRVVPDCDWIWAKAWARRWWRVEADSPEHARELIAAHEVLLAANPNVAVDGRSRGILECGRNGRGGPDALPNHPQEKPAVHRARA